MSTCRPAVLLRGPKKGQVSLIAKGLHTAPLQTLIRAGSATPLVARGGRYRFAVNRDVNSYPVVSFTALVAAYRGLTLTVSATLGRSLPLRLQTLSVSDSPRQQPAKSQG